MRELSFVLTAASCRSGRTFLAWLRMFTMGYDTTDAHWFVRADPVGVRITLTWES